MVIHIFPMMQICSRLFAFRGPVQLKRLTMHHVRICQEPPKHLREVYMLLSLAKPSMLPQPSMLPKRIGRDAPSAWLRHRRRLHPL
jgi:hypothetical protein